MQRDIRSIIRVLYMFNNTVEEIDCWGTRVPHFVGDAGKNIIVVQRLRTRHSTDAKVTIKPRYCLLHSINKLKRIRILLTTEQ